MKTTRLLIAIPVAFTLLVTWFAWSALQAAPPLAAENLRGAGLSIVIAIEKLAVADPTLQSLNRYTTPDIAYFALIDRQGVIQFHTNPGRIGHPYSRNSEEAFAAGLSEERELLGTGEEIYLLHTLVHPDPEEYLLVLALHTYRADQVIRRAKTGVTVVSLLTLSLWGLMIVLFFLLRRDERHQREMARREELARLGEMGALMAHEIRNPLAGIKGFAQLVQGSESLEENRKYAGIIVTQSLRMENLVNDLLSFARNDQGERQRLDLAPLIEDCVALLHQEAIDQQVTIAVNASSTVKVEVVGDRIVQMLLNLMKNALQAMPDGGLLKIALHTKGSMAYLCVSDSGSGIAPQALPHIFSPFWTNKATGTGLGLALCRKVAEEHGGLLSVESTLGVGTEFLVTIPVAK